MTEQKNSRAYKIWEPALLALCTVVGLIAGSQLTGVNTSGGLRWQSSSAQSRSGELNEIVRFIEEKYVDEVNSDVLISSAIQALLKNLDPHSGYLGPEEVLDLNEKMEGHFEGIGIEFQRILDTAIVLYVIPDGPAAKAGLQMFDRIISANDSVLISPDLTEKDMVMMLRGATDNEVRMQIRRPGTDSLITLSMEKAEIPLRSVESAYMISEDIGYIRLNRFSAKTYKEFMEQMERMYEKEGMKELILDLRQNPGGYLKEAVNILSQLFKEKGLLLVFTEGDNAPRTEYHSTGKPFYPVTNIAVLVDEGSASASEIIAGALQDHDRAVIVGTQTYGKGLVQEQYTLSNGGALRLTVARYFTPSGRLIQKPYENGEAVHENKQPEVDTTVYYTTRGRGMNGGGGITPDVLVKQDIDWHDKRFGEMYDAVLEYAIHGYTDTTSYHSLDDLMYRFAPGDQVAQDMIRYFNAKKESNGLDIGFLLENTGQVRTLLMTMIGSTDFGHESWYKIMNSEDPVVQKAKELVKDDIRITLKL